MSDYAFQERIAIKMDSGMLELDAIRETKAEFEAREDHIPVAKKMVKPESVARLEQHRLRVASDMQSKQRGRYD